MVTIPVKTRLRPDGTLDIHVPTGLPESDVDVLLVIEPLLDPADIWPEGFFDRTFGAFSEQPLDRPAQESIDTREALR
jgi:hypothetical protein